MKIKINEFNAIPSYILTKVVSTYLEEFALSNGEIQTTKKHPKVITVNRNYHVTCKKDQLCMFLMYGLLYKIKKEIIYENDRRGKL